MKNHFIKFFILSLITGSFIACVPSQSEKSAVTFNDNKPSSNASTTSTQAMTLANNVTVRMVDRYYVTAILTDVFGAGAATIIADQVGTQMDYFGGGCDHYEKNINTAGTCLNANCRMIACNGLNVTDNLTGGSSVIRQGQLIKACERIAANNTLLIYALQPIATFTVTTAAPPITDANLAKAYGFFYRSEDPSASTIAALKAIADQETSNNFTKWKFVLLGLCTTPQWQVP